MTDRNELPRKVCAEHPDPVPEDEPRAVRERRPEVPELHPAIGAPPQELDLLRRQVLAAHHGRRAVVLLDALVDDQAAGPGNPSSSACPDTASGAGCTASPRARGRTRDSLRSTRACRAGCRRSGRRRRTCRAGAGRRWLPSVALPTRRPLLACGILCAGAQERQVLLEDVLDAEEHVAEPGRAHQRRERRRRPRQSTRSWPARCSRCRSALPRRWRGRAPRTARR